MYLVKHRERSDPPGQWTRAGPFEDLEAAEAFVQALAREHPELEETRVEVEDEGVVCS